MTYMSTFQTFMYLEYVYNIHFVIGTFCKLFAICENTVLKSKVRVVENNLQAKVLSNWLFQVLLFSHSCML